MAFDQLGRPRSLAQANGRLRRGCPAEWPRSAAAWPLFRSSAPEATGVGHSLGKRMVKRTPPPTARASRLASSSLASESEPESASSLMSAFSERKRMNTNKIIKSKLVATSKQSSTTFTTSRNHSSKLAFLALVTFTTILILLTCLTNHRVSSLNCYTCSSADNPGCDETFSANITNTDCEPYIGKQAKVCRKIVQYVENKKVVIRSCGWIDEHEDKKPMCYKRSGTFALMVESCICYEDNCNHSASLVPNRGVLISLACGSMILFYLAAGQHERRVH